MCGNTARLGKGCASPPLHPPSRALRPCTPTKARRPRNQTGESSPETTRAFHPWTQTAVSTAASTSARRWTRNVVALDAWDWRMASGSEKRRRQRLIQVRCTEAEYQAIWARADRAGLYASTYLRAAALGSPGPRALRRPPVNRQELARLLGEIGRVGNNLNQVARALNSGRNPPPQALLEALRDLSEIRSLTRKALGYDE